MLASLQTALQVYCKTYKQAQVSETHGLLRKARRLDKILEAMNPGSTGIVNGVNGSTTTVNGHGHGLGNGVDPSSSSSAAAPAHVHRFASSESAGPTPQCYRCRTEFSPFFHEVPAQGGARAWLCHKCHAETRSAAAAAAVSAAAAYHGQQHPAMIGIGAA